MPSVNAAELTVRINTELNDRGLVDADRRVEETTSRWKTILGTAGGFLLAQGVQLVAREIGGLVQSGLDFEREMANVNSIAQLSADELQTLSNQVLALTNNPGIVDGPAQLAQGLNDIVGAGFAGAEGLMILEAAAMGAAAGQTQTMVATDALTTVINAYKLSAEDAMSVTDQMFRTVDLGKISFEQLASNLGNTVPIAASVGVAFADLGAAYALMTQQGINASIAETQIASLMKSALNPTQQLTDAVQAHGYETAQAVLEQEGLAGFLQIVTEAANGSGEALFDMLGTQEAVNAATALGGENLETYIDFLEQMKGASEGVGATQKALDKQMQSASFRIAKMRQQVQVAATMLMGGLAPAISWAATQMTRFISGGMIPFVGIIGRALRGGFEFRDLVDDLPQPLRRTAGALGSVFESVGDVVRALGDRGLSGAIRTLTQGGELRQLGSAFSAIGQEAWNAAVSGIQAIPWGTLWDFVTETVPQAVPLLFDVLPQIGEWLWDRGTDLVSWAIGHLPGSATRGDGTEGPAGTNAASTVDVLLDLAAQLGEWIWDKGTDIASWAYEHAVSGWDKVVDIGQILIDGAPEAWGRFKEVAGTFGTWAKAQIIAVWDRAVDVGQILINGAPELWGRIKEVAGTFSTWVRAQITAIWDRVVDIGAVLIDGAVDLAGTLADAVSDAAAWLKAKIDPEDDGITVNDITAYINGQMVPGTGFKVADVVDFIKDLWAVDPATEAAMRSSGEDIGKKVGGWIVEGIQSFFGGGEDETVPAWGGAEMIATMLPQDGTLMTALDEFAAGLVNGLWEAINAAWAPFIADWANKVLDIYNTLADVMNLVPGVDIPKFTVEIDENGMVRLAKEAGTKSGMAYVEGTTMAIASGRSKMQNAFDTMMQMSFTSLDAAVAEFQRRSNAVSTSVSEDQWLQDRKGFGGGGASWQGGLQEEALRRAPLQLPGNIRQAPQQEQRQIVIPAPDTSAFDAAMAAIPTTVGTHMSAALGAANAYATGIGTVVGSAIGAMVGNVSALMTGFTNAVGQGMSNALSAASTYSSAIVSVVSAAFGQLPGIAASTTGQIPGIIAANLSGAASIAYSSGLAIGQGLAAGMNASIGAVRAAADQLAAEAARAAQARLQVASPSRVFERIGEQVGDGFVQGIESRYGAAGRAGTNLAGSSIPDTSAAAYGRRGGPAVQIGPVFVLKTDELVRLQEMAERGGQFAKDYPQLLRQGAY